MDVWTSIKRALKFLFTKKKIFLDFDIPVLLLGYELRIKHVIFSFHKINITGEGVRKIFALFIRARSKIVTTRRSKLKIVKMTHAQTELAIL